MSVIPNLSDQLPASVLSQVGALCSNVDDLLDLPLSTERKAKAAYEVEQRRVIHEQLSRMPLDVLKDASEGRLRLGALQSAGIRTVAAVQSARFGLESIEGVGPKTSAQVIAAASQVKTALCKEARVRFDVDGRPRQQTSLLSALRSREIARRAIDLLRPRLEVVARRIKADFDAALLEVRPVKRFFSGRLRKKEAKAAFERLVVLLSEPDTIATVSEMAKVWERLAGPPGGRKAVWDDYAKRPVVYNGLLIEVGGLAPEADASQGFLPQDIVKKIRGLDLDTTLLRASLRGYQSFGAKFALVQGRAILGDEMGLGKTIEALAMLCHLRSHGDTHFLVVSPANVLVNWEHEIRRHSRLEQTWRLHGDDRYRLLRLWTRYGGVAITTFDTLRTLNLPTIKIAAVVIDEAHYVKNPAALRTKAVCSLLSQSKRSLLMSGTPMENRVEEFRTLVNHVRPDIALTIRANAGIAGADAFRRAVAPVYLRRNQTDVLKELPPKIEVAEWLTLNGEAADVYRQAVAAKNFMQMRRAAFLTERPGDSPKLSRLLEIVGEAVENNRKVVVFSYFLDVLKRVHTALGPLAIGPLTGRVSAPGRQLLVDGFSAQREPGVLVSQIQAGGVGLNIQAASVVILTEPQWKPTTEEQAIARCHRMGQVRPVEVHRLLTENSVDEHMLTILARKSALFTDYVRWSVMKDATPEAIDVTDDKSTIEVATQAERERRIIELERRRLGFDA